MSALLSGWILVTRDRDWIAGGLPNAAPTHSFIVELLHEFQRAFGICEICEVVHLFTCDTSLWTRRVCVAVLI